MQKYLSLLLCLAALPLVAAQKPDLAANLQIPHKKFVLKNGLTLIVHEDHKAPIVAVNVWYHVGSKNEKLGKTGFAHLFEHLMFNGSEHFDDDYFKAMEKVGATDLNGTTSEDRTNYFENAPKDALDFLLWMRRLPKPHGKNHGRNKYSKVGSSPTSMRQSLTRTNTTARSSSMRQSSTPTQAGWVRITATISG